MTIFSFITQPDSLQDTFPDLFKPISQEPFQHDFTKLSIVLNQLFEFSGNAFRVIVQPSPEHQPGHEFPGNVVVIDREILKQPIEVIAFILAHEWGHQMLGHLNMPPYLLSATDRSHQEDDADRYAARFQEFFHYPLRAVFRLNKTLDWAGGDTRNAKIFNVYDNLQYSARMVY